MSKVKTGYRVLPIANVYPNPDQPRKLFAQRELEELAMSIEDNGLIQPVRVRPDGKGEFMIIAGERRYRAHLLLGLATIQAIVEDATDDEVADKAIIENLQRKDITPLEEARAFQKRLDTGISVEELARRIGIKQPHRITERTALLKLLPEYQDAFERGLITPSQAFEMSRLGADYQRLFFAAIRDGRCKSYQELRAVSLTLQAAERRGADAGPLFGGRDAGADDQTSMFANIGPTQEERQVATALENKIARVADLLQGGFKDNEVVILRKVRGSHADIVADQLELIERQLRQLRLALRASGVVTSAA